MASEDYVVTAIVGTNAALFPKIFQLYIPEGSVVADVTWGRGIFWQQIDESKYTVLPSDIVHTRGVQADFCALPYASDSLDALLLDPPYLYVGGWKTLRGYFHENTHEWANSSYGNVERSERGISGVKAVDEMYRLGMMEAYRVLMHKGIMVIKCMDQVQSGKQEWAHMKYHMMADEIGFRAEDLFVLVRESFPLMRHKPENQKHARRNHSYAQVFKAWKK